MSPLQFSSQSRQFREWASTFARVSTTLLSKFEFSFTVFFFETVSSFFSCHTTITAETTWVSRTLDQQRPLTMHLANAIQTDLGTRSYLLVPLRQSNDRSLTDRSDDQSIKLPSKTHFRRDPSLSASSIFYVPP